MSKHTIGTRDEWLTARLELLAAEKDLTRRSDEVAQRRQDLPWVRVEARQRPGMSAFVIDDGAVYGGGLLLIARASRPH